MRPRHPGQAQVMTPEAIHFLAELQRRFNARRLELLPPAKSARNVWTPERSPISCPKPSTFANPNGRLLPFRPIFRTAA